jgi:hypothetical protein
VSARYHSVFELPAADYRLSESAEKSGSEFSDLIVHSDYSGRHLPDSDRSNRQLFNRG